MSNYLRALLLFFLGTLLFSCSKDDNNDITTKPPEKYSTQYATDIANIEKFLDSHYMVVTQNPGGPNDMDVKYYEITDPETQTSIRAQTEYPLQTWEVKKHYTNPVEEDVTYKIYYIQFRQGSGPSSKSPCNVDRVLTSYRGEYIYKDATVTDETKNIKSKQFEEVIQPESYLDLTKVILGWSEIFPKFKTGSYAGNSDGTISYNDFGAGVMFIPSGLAYYNSATSSIPSYSPLIFSIKLYEVQRVDHDGDGIYSYQEDINGDGYVRTLEAGVSNPDNSDEIAVLLPDGIKYTKSDAIPDFLDADDDGDYYTTSFEIENHETQEKYPFDLIPTCGGTGNGKKRHLDPSCH